MGICMWAVSCKLSQGSRRENNNNTGRVPQGARIAGGGRIKILVPGNPRLRLMWPLELKLSLIRLRCAKVDFEDTLFAFSVRIEIESTEAFQDLLFILLLLHFFYEDYYTSSSTARHTLED